MYVRLARQMIDPFSIDTRPGDRHKPGRIRTKASQQHNKPQCKPSKWEMRKIVAWDGEGYSKEDGSHVYNLLGCSSGAYIHNDQGITTEQAFDFFFTHAHPDNINVIYGGSYDVNMILGDLDREHVEQLWNDGVCHWKNYRILYAHRKKFTLHRFWMDGKRLRTDTFVLWDVLGYFQSTFVIACRKWLGNLPILDEIEDMKHARSDFTPKQIREIVRYNQRECDLLVHLMESLFDAMDEGEIKLSRYDGAGSIASALLRKHTVREHTGDPTPDALRWAQYAYSGGWIEAPKIGTTEGTTIYRVDINSAYPFSALALPSYRGARWHVEKEWNGSPHSLVHVRWHFDAAPFHPLFYREPDGSILHPQWGEGIYFGVEMAGVEKYHSGKYEVLEALNVTLATEDKPFAWIEEVYALRMKYKAMGSMASEALKLGMNSIYGKLAQQAGYRNGRIPQYHHLLWAGEITARTRAKLYEAAMQHPDSVIAFATDAIISTEPYDLQYGTDLGEWTPEEFDGITIIQPGVYFLSNQSDWTDKYRGFDKGSLLREDIIRAWQNGTDYHAKLTRFVTMGSALGRIDWEHTWRRWVTEPRKLDIVPGGKRIPGQDTCYWDHLCDTLPVENMHFELMSTPHHLEWVEDDSYVRPTMDGVDIRIMEQEYEDSYA